MSKITDKNIFEKGMCISINTGLYRASYRLPKEKFKDLPKKEQNLVRGTFDSLLKDEKKKIDEIISYDNHTRNKIKEQTVPFPIAGVYFVTQNKIDWVLEYIENRTGDERKQLIQEAASVYKSGIKKFKKEVPSLYEIIKDKYPSKQEFIRRFYFNFQFFQVNAPNKNLDFISPELYKQEIEKIRSTVEQVKKEVCNIIYTELLEMAKKIENRLENGKPNQKTINRVEKFAEKIEEIYSDFVTRKDINKIIKDFKNLTNGIEAKELRNNENLSKEFKKDIGKISSNIENLKNVELTRAILI